MDNEIQKQFNKQMDLRNSLLKKLGLSKNIIEKQKLFSELWLSDKFIEMFLMHVFADDVNLLIQSFENSGKREYLLVNSEKFKQYLNEYNKELLCYWCESNLVPKNKISLIKAIEHFIYEELNEGECSGDLCCDRCDYE